MDFIVQPDVPETLTKPFISLIGASLVNVTLSGTYTELGAIAVDINGDILTDNVVISSTTMPEGAAVEESINPINVDTITGVITLSGAAPANDTPILIKNAQNMKIGGIVVSATNLYFVKESSGNTFKVASNIYGDALEITANSDTYFDIYLTPIIDASVTIPYSINYNVTNPDDISADTEIRTIMVKNDASTSISTGASLGISNFTISHDLTVDYETLYRIPVAIGKILSQNAPCGSGSTSSPNTIISPNRDTRYIRADGTIAFSADQTMGDNKLTNLADATDAGDAVNLGQLTNALESLSAPISVDSVVTAGSTGVLDSVSTSTYTAVKWFVSISDSVTGDVYASEVVGVYTDGAIVYNEQNLVGTGTVYDISVSLNVADMEIKLVNDGSNTLNVTVVRFKIA